jgi:hypothetical protein
MISSICATDSKQFGEFTPDILASLSEVLELEENVGLLRADGLEYESAITASDAADAWARFYAQLRIASDPRRRRN